MAGPWEKYGQSAPAPSGPPAFIPGSVSPLKQAAETRANTDQQLQIEDANRKRLEWNATHFPDGRPKPKNEAAPVDPAQLKLIRDEARQKIALIDSLHRRSKNGWFTTGVGSGVMGMMRGTPAYDMARDIETLKNAGALQRVMEMSKANGGKNPLTPLSNSDFAALGSSITNLDQGLSDEKFQENLKVMRDLYLRAFKSAGGSTYMGNRNTGQPVNARPATQANHADDALVEKYLKGGR